MIFIRCYYNLSKNDSAKSLKILIFFCHLPFHTGILAFQLIGLGSYCDEGNCPLLNEGFVTVTISPYAKDHGKVLDPSATTVGFQRSFFWTIFYQHSYPC